MNSIIIEAILGKKHTFNYTKVYQCTQSALFKMSLVLNNHTKFY